MLLIAVKRAWTSDSHLCGNRQDNNHFAFTKLVNLLSYMTMVLAPTEVRQVRGALRAAFLIFYSR